MSITTRGHGRVAVARDTARIHLEVEHVADAADEALAGAQEAQEQAVEVLVRFVELHQVSSAGLRLHPHYREGGPEGFLAGHSLIVAGLAVERAGELVAALARALGDRLRLNGLELTALHTREAEAEARELAVHDARMRAEHLALLAGGVLGVVSSVQDVAESVGSLAWSAQASSARGAVVGGEHDIEQSVTITWELVLDQAGPTAVATSAAPSPT